MKLFTLFFFFLGLLSFPSERVFGSPVSHEEFRDLTPALKKSFALDLAALSKMDGRLHQLRVNENSAYDNWEIEFTQASYVGFLESEEPPVFIHMVNIFGSLARRPYLSKAGLGLIACHEMGHGFSLGPKKTNGEAVEGEADYFAGSTCLARLIDAGYLTEATDHQEYMDLCADRFPVGNRRQICLIQMRAVQDFKVFLETDFYKKADIHAFSRERLSSSRSGGPRSPTSFYNATDEYYPSAQCRFESVIHGILELPRPSCWYSPFPMGPNEVARSAPGN